MLEQLRNKLGIILIVIIILCSICGIAIYILKQNKTGIIETENEATGEIIGDEKVEYKANNLNDPVKFFSIQSCIQNNIDSSFIAKDMNLLEGDRIYSYSVYGSTETKEKIFYIFRVDIENMTFLLEDVSDNYSNINNINLETKIEKIEENGKNTFEYITMSNEDICRFYLENFTTLELKNTEEAYSMLNEDYKEERFVTFDNYKEYVNECKEIIEISVLTKYSVEYFDDYIRYTLVDTYNNTYIIEATGVMNYTVKLDNYTIKVENYNEDYSNLSDDNKVQTNVYIFLQMINTKDYNHAYELLDNTFKNNNFNTIQKFKEYIKNNFFNYNLDVREVTIKQEGNYYIYETTIKSNSGNDAEAKTLTVIMQLKEGTDFVMSFNVE